MLKLTTGLPKNSVRGADYHLRTLYAERSDRNPVSLKRVLSRVKLEHGLVLGAILAIVGFIGDAAVAAKWARSDFGPLSDERAVLFWSLWQFLGVQIFLSFFFSACWESAEALTSGTMKCIASGDLPATRTNPCAGIRHRICTRSLLTNTSARVIAFK